MHRTQRFIEPLDVLFLRGNKLFGDPGSFGDSLMPPWPSVAAGALRSALLSHKGIDPVRFGRGAVEDDALGTPDNPGPFAVTAFHLARRTNQRVEPLFQPPADLIVKKRDKDGLLMAQALRPVRLDEQVLGSLATGCVPVLCEQERGKPDRGWWLTAEGWRQHLNCDGVEPEHLVPQERLWSTETRVGVGLDTTQRRAADGQLFSMAAVSLRQAGQGGHGCDVGFLAETVGAQFPQTLALRLGGDGRCAIAKQVTANMPQIDYETIAREGRCRLVLTAPGIFAGGWRPTGTQVDDDGNLLFSLHGVKAHLTCAAVPRAETVSGFDVAKGMPKPALRAAPTGSVYWLEGLEATPNALRNLAAHGLWSDPVENPQRRAEGFNRFVFGRYPKE